MFVHTYVWFGCIIFNNRRYLVLYEKNYSNASYVVDFKIIGVNEARIEVYISYLFMKLFYIQLRTLPPARFALSTQGALRPSPRGCATDNVEKVIELI